VPRGDYRQTVYCAGQPCPEKITYHHLTRADEAASVRDQQKHPWKCSRHLMPETVLSPDREVIASTVTVVPRPDARSWETPRIWQGPDLHSTLNDVSGLGWQAFAGDWPEGTRLEVTARILPPLDVEAAVRAQLEAES
jgi:hypothetical protein